MVTKNVYAAVFLKMKLVVLNKTSGDLQLSLWFQKQVFFVRLHDISSWFVVTWYVTPKT